LRRRREELAEPIQCDALAQNVPKEFETILSNCLVHARRNFVKVIESFPEECRFVLETLAVVFRNDALARQRGLSAAERLEFHRSESMRPMATLRLWMQRELKEKRVERNSGLGRAMAYMRKHWRKLTRFLYIPGAPLENNVVERGLKMAIRHRRNSLFYKTQNGAWVGDVFMSLIHTAELAGENPFAYLCALLRHAEELPESPEKWLPWNYRETLAGREEA
ncbi:MAG: IS66 family transposase, partial [Vicinamibacteria bacterium]